MLSARGTTRTVGLTCIAANTRRVSMSRFSHDATVIAPASVVFASDRPEVPTTTVVAVTVVTSPGHHRG